MKLARKLFYIEWLDSSRFADGWWLETDIETDSPPTKCVSVGFLAKDNIDCIVLLPNISGLEREAPGYTYGGVKIPKIAITLKKELLYNETDS